MTKAAVRLGFMLGASGLALWAGPVRAQDVSTDGATAQAEGQAPEVTADAEDGAIIVTARRRDESLQEVPVAVTSLSGDDLTARSTRDLRDFSSVAPNLQVTGSNYGSTYAVVNLRGQDNANQRGSYDPAIGIYFDEVYLGRSSGALMSSLIDMQSVQVLRGPQATLFGRNNTGGAILLTPNRPGLSELTGEGYVGYGSFDRFEVGGVLDVPIVEDRFGIRAVYQRQRQDGTGYSVTNGVDTYGDRNRDVGRVSARWRPMNNIVFDFTYDFARIDETGNIWYNVSNPGPEFYSTTAGINDPRSYAKIDGFTLRAQIDVTNDMTLKLIGSRRLLSTINQTDVDGGPPSTVLDQFSFADQNQWTGEAQLSGTTLRDSGFLTELNYTAGFFYFWERGLDGAQLPLGTPLFGTLGRGYTGGNVNRSTAGYLQVESNHGEKLFLTAGGRYTSDYRSLEIQSVSLGLCTIAALPPATPIDSCRQFGEASFGYWSYSLGARYQFSRDVNAYVRYDRGQRSGGLDDTPTSITSFDPEVVSSFEAGLKLELFDRRLRVNAAAFYNDYENIQRASRLIDADGDVYTSVFNAASGQIKGLELEVNAVPVGGLTLGGTLGLLDAEYTEFVDPRPGPGNGGDLSYLRFPTTPKASYSLYGSYEAQLGDAGTLTFRADYSHRSRVNFDVYNDPRAEQVGFGLLNARIGLNLSEGILGTPFELAVWGRNLTEAKYDDNALPATNVRMRNDSPRMFGAEVRVRF